MYLLATGGDIVVSSDGDTQHARGVARSQSQRRATRCATCRATCRATCLSFTVSASSDTPASSTWSRLSTLLARRLHSQTPTAPLIASWTPYAGSRPGQRRAQVRAIGVEYVKGKCKVFPYSLPSVGPGADPGVQAGDVK